MRMQDLILVGDTGRTSAQAPRPPATRLSLDCQLVYPTCSFQGALSLRAGCGQFDEDVLEATIALLREILQRRDAACGQHPPLVDDRHGVADILGDLQDV